MIDAKRLILTGPRRALGEQLDSLERRGVPLACPRVDLDESEMRQLRRRLQDLERVQDKG